MTNVLRVYPFEDIDERLPLLPLAARRALDNAGRRLSLAAWRELPLSARVTLVEQGGLRHVQLDPVLGAIASAQPPAEPCPQRRDGELDRCPAAASDMGVDVGLWQLLDPLERFVLAHLAKRQRRDQLRRALLEMGHHGAVAQRLPASANGSAAGEVVVHASAAVGQLTHLSASGEAHMVDVADKPITQRVAVAGARVVMKPATAQLVEALTGPKGDVLAVARVAGIMAAKRTPELIPLCHNIMLTRVTIRFRVEREAGVIHVEARAEARDRTGVEMEAMVAASVAALTIYDMLKAVEKGIVVEQLLLLSKDGGRSGRYRYHDPSGEEAP